MTRRHARDIPQAALATPAAADAEPGSGAGARAAAALLEAHGLRWWQAGDAAALDDACRRVSDAALPSWPGVARWRALAAFLEERGDALECLELAHAGHAERGEHDAAALDAGIALVFCLTDGGAMASVEEWTARAGGSLFPASATVLAEEPSLFWRALGEVAREVFGDARTDSGADEARRWLSAELQRVRSPLSADERLIAAQVLVSSHLAAGRYEQFDLLANAVEEPVAFAAARPLVRGRWLHTLGLAHYHIGSAERAEAAWKRATALAHEHALPQLALLSSLAVLRLLLDRGRLDEAAALRAGIEPRWGSGRSVQLMYLRQMDGRLALLRGQAFAALAHLDDALALAAQLGLGISERASCDTDYAQALIGASRVGEAIDLLGRLANEHAGRDADVFETLLELLHAWTLRDSETETSRRLLDAGLRRAREIRYTMFFRLLPDLAGGVCGLALRSGIEAAFVAQIVRSRDLPAPADADASWPWPVYLRLFGQFDMRLFGELDSLKPKRKVQKKPIELLQLLGCAPGLALAAGDAADALWPEAEGDLARKSLEMTVQRLRRLLGDDAKRILVVSDGRIWLDSRQVRSDVELRRALIAQLGALRAGPVAGAQALVLLRQIVELTVGALLDGQEDDTGRLQAERSRCRREAERAARAVSVLLANVASLRQPALGGLLSERTELELELEELRRRSST